MRFCFASGTLPRLAALAAGARLVGVESSAHAKRRVAARPMTTLVAIRAPAAGKEVVCFMVGSRLMDRSAGTWCPAYLFAQPTPESGHDQLPAAGCQTKGTRA